MVRVSGASHIFGEVSLSGAKNAALPIIVGACLCSDDVVLKNMPTELNDVKVMISVLRQVGFPIDVEEHNIRIANSLRTNIVSDVPIEAQKIRYSLLLLPLLLTHIGKVNNPMPGGCNLGDRKYDIHLQSLNALGANVEETENGITGTLDKKFKGTDLHFHIATTSGSESTIIAAALSDGKTTIRNANTRPEVIDLINFLNAMGAKITYSTRYIEIEGVETLSGGEYTIIDDSHEAVSLVLPLYKETLNKACA